MNKETSSRVSSIAAEIMKREPAQGLASPEANVTAYNALLEKAKTLAASCMSQDEHAGQDAPKGDFLSRLKDEREDLDRRVTALASYLNRNPGHPNPRHNEMLKRQLIAMSEYLVILDERLTDLGISERSAPVEEIPIGNEDDGA